MDPIVALDIETTGLDPDQDAIIEIGAVRFTDRRVEGEWDTLINPGRRIPPFITQLTGIRDSMVLHAPHIDDVLADLVEFIGDAPILGHNVRFDISFLSKRGILRRNILLDTYEMAAVLLPNAGRYNLGALTQALNVPLPATHRALEDAQATRGVFLRLYEEALTLPISLLAEIVRLSEEVDWLGYWPMRLALGARSRETTSGKVARHGYDGPLFAERPRHAPPSLLPYGEPVPLDIELKVVGRITNQNRRLFEGTGEILLPDGEVAVEGQGKYIKLPLEEIADFDYDEQEWKITPGEGDPEEIDLP